MAYNSTGRVVHDADAHIMETPTWLRDHADPASATASSRWRYPGGNELRQTGDPDEQLRDLDAAFDRLPAKHRVGRVPRGRGRRDHAPQELRGHRLVPPRGPAPRARPARLLEPARVQHVPQPAAARLGARRRPRARLRRRPRPQPRHGRVLLASTRGCCRRCYVPLADFDRAAAMADEAIDDGRGRAARRVGLPAGPLAEPPSASIRCGPSAQEAGIPIVFHVGGTGDLIDPTTSATACRSRPTSTAARRTSARSTTWASPVPPAQTLATMIFDGVFERFPDLRVGVIEQGAIWVPSWMRQMESAFDAFAPPRGAAPAAVAAARASTCAARCGSRRTRPRTSAGSSSRPGPRCAVLVRLPARRGRPPADRALRGVARRRVRRRVRQAFYCDNFLDLMGPRLAALSEW